MKLVKLFLGDTIKDRVITVLAIVFGLVATYGLGIMLSALSAFITSALVTLGTCAAINKGRKVMAFGGIALYLISWPATSAWGVWTGMLVWSLGIIAWFSATGIFDAAFAEVRPAKA